MVSHLRGLDIDVVAKRDAERERGHDSGPRVAPLYDLLSTVSYPELSPGLAMRMGKHAMLEELDAEAWAAFASGATLGLPLVRRRVAEMSESVAAKAEEAAGTVMQPGLDEAALLRLASLVAARARLCARSTRR